MKLQKDKIIKDIPVNLVSIYLGMGWKKVDDKELKNQDYKNIGKTKLEDMDLEEK